MQVNSDPFPEAGVQHVTWGWAAVPGGLTNKAPLQGPASLVQGACVPTEPGQTYPNAMWQTEGWVAPLIRLREEAQGLPNPAIKLRSDVTHFFQAGTSSRTISLAPCKC